jgi:hypothetical protein
MLVQVLVTDGTDGSGVRYAPENRGRLFSSLLCVLQFKLSFDPVTPCGDL